MVCETKIHRHTRSVTCDTDTHMACDTDTHMACDTDTHMACDTDTHMVCDTEIDTDKQSIWHTQFVMCAQTHMVMTQTYSLAHRHTHIIFSKPHHYIHKLFGLVPIAGRSGVKISPTPLFRVPRCNPVSGKLTPSGNGGGPFLGAYSSGSEYIISPLQPYFWASAA